MNNKVQLHSLVVGCDAAPSLLQFPCETGYRVKSGTQGTPFAFGGLQEAPYWCPVAGSGVTADSLFVKIGEPGNDYWPSPTGQTIEVFDVATGFFKSVATWSTGQRNFLIDGDGALVTWDASGTNIVKYPPTGPLPFDFITSANNPGLIDLVNTGPMQWSPGGDLCLLMWDNSGDGNQVIRRFDGSSGAYLGDLISAPQYFRSIEALPSWFGENGEWFAFGNFAFGQDGTIYASDGIRVVRFDGATGDFIDVFIQPDAFGWSFTSSSPQYPFFLPGWDVGDLLLSPDGELLYVTVGAHSYNAVYVFAVATGARTGTFSIGPRPSSWKTFITQEVPGNIFGVGRNYKPEYPLPHIIFLTKILTGVVSDSPGIVTATGQGPYSSAYWTRVAIRIWNALGSEEREAVIAFGMLQLSTLLTNAATGVEVKMIFERNLDGKIYRRLQTLLRDFVKEEQRDEGKEK